MALEKTFHNSVYGEFRLECSLDMFIFLLSAKLSLKFANDIFFELLLNKVSKAVDKL